jgi:hypothetical protein
VTLVAHHFGWRTGEMLRQISEMVVDKLYYGELQG